MAVGSDSLGPEAAASLSLPSPLLPSLGRRPDGHVVVDKVGEVVGDKVFARHPQIQRVPVAKLSPKLPAEETEREREGGREVGGVPQPVAKLVVKKLPIRSRKSQQDQASHSDLQS